MKIYVPTTERKWKRGEAKIALKTVLFHGQTSSLKTWEKEEKKNV